MGCTHHQTRSTGGLDGGVPVTFSEATGSMLAPPRGRVQRVQRYPQYSDDELKPWFAEVAKGYCFWQAAERCGYDRQTILNTIYSDDEVFDHGLSLSMWAGAKIRAGELPVPDRHDGLYKGK